MPENCKLESYLDEQGVKYVTLRHSAAYTTQELAAILHIAGQAMVVLPASRQINFQRLRAALQGKKVELSEEWEYAYRFPDCELGAMPPFGNLYDMQVYVDQRLTEDKEIVFNDGSFATAVKMRYADFARLVQPTVVDVSV